MKAKNKNKISRTGRWSALAVLGFAVVAIVGTGITLGYGKLRDLWLEQCEITDMDRQVTIASGKMVKADVLASELGLRPGANLATIDFAARRAATLEKIPNLRELKIRRFLPGRVTVDIEERTPIVRLGIRGQKGSSGKVADAEGVVFFCARGTQLLPVIREPLAPGTAVGRRLENRAWAALQVVDACRDASLMELGILEIDVSHPDWLSATLNTGASYAQLKLAWDGMDAAPSIVSRASLNRQLTHLRDALRSHVGDGAVIWNATDFSSPGRIYADTKGKL